MEKKKTTHFEQYNRYGLIFAIIMLALIVPLTLFAIRQENDVRSHASESISPVVTISPTVTPTKASS